MMMMTMMKCCAGFVKRKLRVRTYAKAGNQRSFDLKVFIGNSKNYNANLKDEQLKQMLEEVCKLY